MRLKEFELLAALASTPGELRSREELAKEVWGHAGVGSSRTIDVHIRRIRASLERSPPTSTSTQRGASATVSSPGHDNPPNPSQNAGNRR